MDGWTDMSPVRFSPFRLSMYVDIVVVHVLLRWPFLGDTVLLLHQTSWSSGSHLLSDSSSLTFRCGSCIEDISVGAELPMIC